MIAVRRLGPGCVIGLLVVLGCTKPVPQAGPAPTEDGAIPPSAVAKVEGSAPSSTAAVKPEVGGEAFHNLSFADALQKARIDNKLVMVDFYADWCKPCKQLDATTWKDPKVQGWLRDKTVAIKLDKDKTKAVVEKYKIGVLPALLFVKPDGFEVGRLIGYHSAEQFLRDAGDLIALK